ncbi:uncharacterized protein FIBRA_00223 [Fibroporia radiculosa]|uniref:5-formyltetrahydrofolate cyclo-ligase n=1 Tax=Fibroporia radiculosa TaxID=599839 RepID=J7S5U5_9APHY|nr:uncharacterized protein FIBRA_00223 [Fibroporia radiculosa]CCL98229.1 predicted protein [Fibroporia radiculosa]
MAAHKAALRKAMSISLRSLSPSDLHHQSQIIVDRVLASPLFLHSKNVSCYLSMPTGEVETSALASAILRAGKTLFVPKIDVAASGRMDFLKVYGEEDLRTFPAGAWGIKEPAYEFNGQRRSSALEEGSEQLDLVLVPGVAFDRSLSRLGHGKGYYDRFISSYSSSKSADGLKKPLLVALALREQILEAGQVPTALHDCKMDVIIGPEEVIGRLDHQD